MKRYKKLNSRVFQFIALALGFIVVSCSGPNNEIGTELLPASTDYRVISENRNIYGVIDFSQNSSNYEEQFNVSNLSSVTIGLQKTPGFRKRSAGFYTQFTPAFNVDDDGFGYEPFVDSVLFYPTVVAYSGDTTQTVNYTVYEITNNDFLTNSPDTVFTLKAANELFAGDNASVPKTALFNFNFPDNANGVYLNSTYLRMNIEPAGESFLDRLMLKNGASVDIYNSDYETFISDFKGIYIAPTNSDIATEGNSVTFDISGSGFGFYARNLNPEDPQYIKDTVGMTYIFRDNALTSIGNVSISTVQRATTFEVGGEQLVENAYVEGLYGETVTLAIRSEFFESLDQMLEDESEGEQVTYTDIFFNRFTLRMYLSSLTDYAFTAPTPELSKQANNSFSRLAMYKNYTNLLDGDGAMLVEPVVDYDYISESYYGTLSYLDGSMNRSKACYEFNISLEIQEMWQKWTELKESSAQGNVDLSDVDWNKIIIAPDMSNLSSPQNVTLWSASQDGNSAGDLSTQLSATYTLIKR